MEQAHELARGGKLIYLDNNATTRPSPAALKAMKEVGETAWGNPSSLYERGRRALRELDVARQTFARHMRVEPSCIVFTSCGTESNNIALRSVMCRAIRAGQGDVLVTTTVEHPSVKRTADAIVGCKHVTVPVDEQGYVDEQAYISTLKAYKKRVAMVSLIMAQNEVGTIQQINRLADIAREVVGEHVVVHTDATQSFGKYYIYPDLIGVDLMTASAHKFHGPRGVGILYCRKTDLLSGGDSTPMTGGGQEKGCRSGTENVAAIVGAAIALDEQLGDVRQWRARSERVKACRDAIMRRILRTIDGARVNGDPSRGLYNTLSIALPGVKGHEMVELLDKRSGIAVSAGSACSKGKPSETIRALYERAHGDSKASAVAHSTIRISLGGEETDGDCEYACERIVDAYDQLAKI